MSDHAASAVAEAFHDEWGRVVATLIGMTGDWDLAEECAQEAFAQALDRWPGDGVPRRPGAWLTTVARNRALDRLRRRTNEKTKLEQAALLSRAAEGDDVYDDSGVPDDRLRLMFTCCHPALSLEAQVALTLRTLAGLTTAEVARAFLVEEPTMAKRLVRAKGKIRHAGIPYRVPPARLLPERTAGVLAVVYLLFNEGYVASAGAPLMRSDLAAESIRLARLLVALMPGEAEAGGLLALLLLQDSRRAARVDAAGELVTLEDQDRSLWDHAAIDEGRRQLDAAASALGRPGPVPAAGPDRGLPLDRGGRGRHRLGSDRPPVRTPRAAHAVARRGAQPGRRGRDVRRSGGRARAGRRPCRRPASSRATTSSRRPGQTCCAGLVARARRRRATARRSTSSPRMPSGATSPAGWSGQTARRVARGGSSLGATKRGLSPLRGPTRHTFFFGAHCP